MSVFPLDVLGELVQAKKRNSVCQQGAQLSQRDRDRAMLRVIEYFAKSLTQGHSKGVCKSLLVFH